MSIKNKPVKESVMREALSWRLAFEDGETLHGDSYAAHEEFSDWLLSSETNANAYRSLERVWLSAEILKPSPELAKMRDEALSLKAAPKTSFIDKAVSDARAWANAAVASFDDIAFGSTPALSLNGLAVMGIASVLFVTGYFAATSSQLVPGSQQVAQVEGRQIFETAIGEKETVTLSDGTEVTLNTDSRVAVAYTDGARRVTLERGQALFDVAKNKDRPFFVNAQNKRVIALGTSFDVDMSRDNFSVTLLEGSVAVTDSDHSNDQVKSIHSIKNATLLKPGQQFRTGLEGDNLVVDVDLEKETSWRDGRLIFVEESFFEAINQVNRYSTKKIVVGDSLYTDYNISGVFKTGNIDGFVTAIENVYPVKAKLRPNGDIVIDRNDVDATL